ncbi:hypothetical protein [Aurantiacibacter aquimixticola]|uniref:Uncharacterized protein n=1 Tax=Aurantiacibacter aquimixticola TaxID=1958945 RepID=A0A419RU90_9SPHN|nr:hypothetical protein [Aurantiacibacter aquimixticola]RJY09357.1 hypothetical protein D6201_08315 [Aurantiacibacter aquimixticola]
MPQSHTALEDRPLIRRRWFQNILAIGTGGVVGFAIAHLYFQLELLHAFLVGMWGKLLVDIILERMFPDPTLKREEDAPFGWEEALLFVGGAIFVFLLSVTLLSAFGI